MARVADSAGNATTTETSCSPNWLSCITSDSYAAAF
nr:MAG TPA: hypothetical protein [Caudoviricetes sp.]